MLSSIYLDMDGTLVDLVRHTYRLVLPEHRINEAHAATLGWDTVDRVIAEELGVPFDDAALQELWKSGGQEFWASVPWLPWGQRLVGLCRRFAPTLIMTAPTRAPSCAAGKLQWIMENLPEDLHRKFALSPCKELMAHPGAILIDDADHNIDAFVAAGGEGFLWPMPWNASGRAGITAHEALGLLESKLQDMLGIKVAA